jgi:hypothetical protein
MSEKSRPRRRYEASHQGYVGHPPEKSFSILLAGDFRDTVAEIADGACDFPDAVWTIRIYATLSRISGVSPGPFRIPQSAIRNSPMRRHSIRPEGEPPRGFARCGLANPDFRINDADFEDTVCDFRYRKRLPETSASDGHLVMPGLCVALRRLTGAHLRCRVLSSSLLRA